MPSQAWTITDNSSGEPEVWAFPISPNKFTPPGRSASIRDESTTGSTGGVILFQGRDAVPTLTFSGTIDSAAFKEDLEEQLNKWYDLVLTDDQGNDYNVIFTEVSFERIKSAINHHRFHYNVTAKVLG